MQNQPRELAPDIIWSKLCVDLKISSRNPWSIRHKFWQRPVDLARIKIHFCSNNAHGKPSKQHECRVLFDASPLTKIIHASKNFLTKFAHSFESEWQWSSFNFTLLPLLHRFSPICPRGTYPCCEETILVEYFCKPPFGSAHIPSNTLQKRASSDIEA